MGLQLQMVSIRQAYNIQNNIKDTIINISLNQFSDSWTLDHKDLHTKHFLPTKLPVCEDYKYKCPLIS